MPGVDEVFDKVKAAAQALADKVTGPKPELTEVEKDYSKAVKALTAAQRAEKKAREALLDAYKEALSGKDDDSVTPVPVVPPSGI